MVVHTHVPFLHLLESKPSRLRAPLLHPTVNVVQFAGQLEVDPIVFRIVLDSPLVFLHFTVLFLDLGQYLLLRLFDFFKGSDS
jgi:hypothetical protein